jgi:hypothetical protein
VLGTKSPKYLEMAQRHISLSIFPWGSGPTVATLEYIVFLGHVVALEPSTWWGQVLFATRLRIAAWTVHLHTVVTGTPFPGY